MATNEISVMDVIDNSSLRRRITRFLQLCRLAVDSKINDARKANHVGEARNILRAIFGRAPKSDQRVLGLADMFAFLLDCANAVLRSCKSAAEVVGITIHISRVA